MHIVSPGDLVPAAIMPIIGTNLAELFLCFFLTEVVVNPDKQHIGFKAFLGW